MGLCRKVIASKSYRSWNIEVVIATYSYHSGNILTVIAFKGYYSASKAKAITCNAVTFCSNVADLWKSGHFLGREISWVASFYFKDGFEFSLKIGHLAEMEIKHYLPITAFYLAIAEGSDWTPRLMHNS